MLLKYFYFLSIILVLAVFLMPSSLDAKYISDPSRGIPQPQLPTPSGLENEYPTLLPGITLDKDTTLPELINYLYTASLYLVGLIGLGIFIYAGFQWMTSVGNPSKQSDAKDRITQAVIGIILLLGSWLLLNTINPDLLRIPQNVLPALPPEFPSGW